LGHTIIGKWSYGNPVVHRWDDSKLKIGNFCSFGQDVKIYMGGNHRSDWITTSPLPADEFSNFFTNASGIKNFTKEKKDLEIGSDVWVGGAFNYSFRIKNWSWLCYWSRFSCS